MSFFEKLPGGDKAERVFACGASSAVLTKSGKVYVWGKNEVGQLGLATIEDDFKNRFVVEPLPKLLTTLSMGSNTITFLSSDAAVYISGLSIWTFPYKVTYAEHYQPKAVTSGEDYFSFLDKRGIVVSYGGPFTGEENRTDDLPEGMTVVKKEFFNGDVVKLIGGYDYCAAIVSR